MRQSTHSIQKKPIFTGKCDMRIRKPHLEKEGEIYIELRQSEHSIQRKTIFAGKCNVENVIWGKSGKYLYEQEN